MRSGTNFAPGFISNTLKRSAMITKNFNISDRKKRFHQPRFFALGPNLDRSMKNLKDKH
jgi:hypothetical protein